MKTTLFLPVKDEIEGLRLILPRIRREWVDEILVVDGNSTDGTFEFCQQMGLRTIRQRTDGICGAYWECLEAAQGDVIIPFSPDNNSIPELIPEVLAKLREGNDMVIVSRYLPGAASEDDDAVTRFGNWMFTSLVNLFFGAQYTDSLVMFRGFRRDLVKDLALDERVLPVFEVQLGIRCAKAGRRVVEIPGSEPKRIGGERKMRPLYNGAAISYVIVKELLNRRNGLASS